MRGEVHILVHCPIDTLQWGSTHSALVSLSGPGGKKNRQKERRLMKGFISKAQHKVDISYIHNTDFGKLILFYRLALGVALRFQLPSLPTFSW